MKVYTEAEYDRLYRETLSYEQIKTNFNGFDVVKAAKSQWSEEEDRYVNLSSGIKLDICDEQIFLDRNHLGIHDGRQLLTAKFYLSGYHSVICPGIDGIAPKYTETRGRNYLFYLPDIEEIEQYWSGDRWKILRMEIDLDTIRRFVTELDTVPKQLQKLIEDKNPQRFHFAVGGITTQMQTIIGQICHHPYQGAIARMYLEGKILELLALQLSQLLQTESSQLKLEKLTAKDVDRLYIAKEILKQNYHCPPSVIDLARQVGLEHMKLKRGFRQQFNTTPFGYLRNYRLEQADRLLREKNLTVAQVVAQVGYSNIGHFSNAFKRKYGISPGQCRAGKRIVLD